MFPVQTGMFPVAISNRLVIKRLSPGRHRCNILILNFNLNRDACEAKNRQTKNPNRRHLDNLDIRFWRSGYVLLSRSSSFSPQPVVNVGS